MMDPHRIRLPRGALASLRRADPALGLVIDRVGRCGLQVGSGRSSLEALVRSIVYQQLSGKAAATIFGRFCDLFAASPFPGADEILRLHHARMRKAGISRAKQLAIRDLCRHVADGRLPLHDVHDLPDDELVERLTAVRGIGEWSAQMFMMFHLGRLDVWAPGDLGIRKAVALVRGLGELPDKRRMLQEGELYRPYRTVASWYLWRALELPADAVLARPQRRLRPAATRS
jgi:3-methyladenine DNA glycosylase/8-oxoguanine DNA glycosylase